MAEGVGPNGPSCSPWQNRVAERWVEAARRDLLDHVIVLNERHLHRLLSELVAYQPDAASLMLFSGVEPSAPRAGPRKLSSKEPDWFLARDSQYCDPVSFR